MGPIKEAEQMKIAEKSEKSIGLGWPQLISGTLVKRYKRFMADVKLASGEIVTAHCPNSGSMQECCEPGRPVYLSIHDNPRRKLKYTWEIIEMPTSLVGINTMIPNRLVFKSIASGIVKELKGYDSITREVKTKQKSRLDLLLTKEELDQCFVEIKNCTLVKDGCAFFPDAVTSRGLKHLVELQELVSSGFRCVMFYLIQRMDARVFQPADHIDPAYGKALRQAADLGVEILIYDVRLDLKTISLNRKIPYNL
jgi:sugar fermentation stimulation protein A